MKKAVILSVFAIWFYGPKTFAQTTLDVFPGGSGDGSSSQKTSSMFLSGPVPVSPDYFGGSGDGSAFAQVNGSTLSGIDNAFSFNGGSGDGSFAATTNPLTLSGTVQAALFFSGGSGDGGAIGSVSNIFVSGAAISGGASIDFLGGSGDGISSSSSVGQFLSGNIPDFPFPGGIGRGSASLATSGIFLGGTAPVFLYTGGIGRGDASRKTNTVLLSGTASLARVAQFEIQDFKAVSSGDQIRLEWKTAEKGDQFVVESSDDGANFSSIGWLSGKRNPTNLYSYHAFANGAQPQYFRIKNQLENLDIAISDVIRVDFDLRTPVQLYPNPVTDVVNLETTNGSAIGLVEVFDLNGRKLLQAGFSQGIRQELNLGKLPPGLYRLLMQLDTGEWQEIKITKQ